MLHAKNVPGRFWAEAMKTAAFVINRLPQQRKSYLQVTSQKLARGKLVHLHGRRSLALPSVGSSELKAF
ncbi:hypothetical protein CK203_114927 [Vitis vinifera]|uniref:Retrovirus-related Pol polyprotein from transposon TNT 1-94 n=1 Tax=Vitis vinifera TaxID=29760 RepID=A0A438CBB4_VITVI|nr:hypothetical protein CK203_114927 [Vitis vinifera]